MGFERLLGNEHIKANLEMSLEKGHISHFYLISGPEGSGKHTLADLLAAANRAYHQLDAPEITDAEYDALKARNQAIEARFPALKRVDSVSDQVGAAATEGFGKVRHAVPMLSLDEAREIDPEAMKVFTAKGGHHE